MFTAAAGAGLMATMAVSAVNMAIVGAVVGGLTAAITGGDVGMGVLVGAIGGAVGGAVMGAVGYGVGALGNATTGASMAAEGVESAGYATQHVAGAAGEVSTGGGGFVEGLGNILGSGGTGEVGGVGVGEMLVQGVGAAGKAMLASKSAEDAREAAASEAALDRETRIAIANAAPKSQQLASTLAQIAANKEERLDTWKREDSAKAKISSNAKALKRVQGFRANRSLSGQGVLGLDSSQPDTMQA